MILHDSEFNQTAIHNHSGNGPCPQCEEDAKRHRTVTVSPAILEFKLKMLRKQLDDAGTIIKKQSEDLLALRVRNIQLERFIANLAAKLDG